MCVKVLVTRLADYSRQPYCDVWTVLVPSTRNNMAKGGNMHSPPLAASKCSLLFSVREPVQAEDDEDEACAPRGLLHSS